MSNSGSDIVIEIPIKIQGGQDPFLKFQMAITQKLSISDPSLVKPI